MIHIARKQEEKRPQTSSFNTETNKRRTLYAGTMSAVTFILLSWIMESSGTEAKLGISFTPNWATILQGESMTMTCTETPVQQNVQEYSWYRDQQPLQSSEKLIIRSAEPWQSGAYQCTTPMSSPSDPLSLDVHIDPVILQVPPSVHEGDDVSMRCHRAPGYETGNKQFYYENLQIANSASDTYSIRNINMSQAGTYRCVKYILNGGVPYKYWFKTRLSVKELYSRPVITVTPDHVIEGTDVTLTCSTSLSPFRAGTAIQFAFYRNSELAREFESSDKYRIQSVNVKESGDFNCEVRTASERLTKRSDTKHIQIQEWISSLEIKVSPEEVTHGDEMHLTCDTGAQAASELLYAFYRNKETVQRFSSSNKHLVVSAQPEHSGDYTCEVKTSTYNVTKRSHVLHVQIHSEEDHTERGTNSDVSDKGGIAGQPYLIAALVSSLLVLLIVVILAFVFRRRLARTRRKPPPSHPEKEVIIYEEPTRSENITLAPGPPDNENTEPAGSELCYAEIKISSKAEDSMVRADNVVDLNKALHNQNHNLRQGSYGSQETVTSWYVMRFVIAGTHSKVRQKYDLIVLKHTHSKQSHILRSPATQRTTTLIHNVNLATKHKGKTHSCGYIEGVRFVKD
uniref:Ig-like domain-containing protein n=1 Tax=Leptobrachium leishanense TaxID=445787 RepID=A0A8C5R573_9ANUR